MLDPPSSLQPTDLERAAPGAARRAGWTLTLALAAVVAALSLAIVLAGGASAEAIGRAIRFTARTSFALFLAAYTASALYRLWPRRVTRSLRRNRRYLGVAFAASHAIHAAVIAALAVLQPAAFQAHASDMVRAPGLVAYGLVAAMAATSFDRAAAWIGPRAWKWLHRVGSLYVWGAFLQAFVSRALHAPAYWLGVALAATAMALRVVAWRAGPRAPSGSPRQTSPGTWRSRRA